MPAKTIDQAAMWNGVAGQNWVEAQALLDAMFEPFERLLTDTVCARGGGAVLDVGCGTGATVIALARDRQQAGAGAVTGIDISGPMTALARQRLADAGLAADIICADAQDHPLGEARFDQIVSRFGVMFFRDPVAAFTRLRRAARPGGQLFAIAWRAPDENPFMTVAERAAAPLLPGLAGQTPPPTGQFAFADAGRVGSILDTAGWTGIDIRPVDVACCLPETALETYFTRLGPLGRVLSELDADLAAHVVDAVRAGYTPFIDDGAVRFTAACWTISAGAPQ